MGDRKSWLKVEDIARELSVSPRTVYRWLTEGRLKGKNLGGKAGWRIRPADLEEFIQKLPGSETEPEEKDAA